MPHIAKHILQNISRRVCMAVVAAHQESIKVQLRQLRIVIEHFLEVWDQPFTIDGVPRKSPTKVIVDAPRRHPFASMQHHFYSIFIMKSLSLAQQKLRLAWLWEFRRVAKSPIFRIVSLLELSSRLTDYVGG